MLTNLLGITQYLVEIENATIGITVCLLAGIGYALEAITFKLGKNVDKLAMTYYFSFISAVFFVPYNNFDFWIELTFHNLFLTTIMATLGTLGHIFYTRAY
jgi:hypothetical protein